jgi:hypothetical protein
MNGIFAFDAGTLICGNATTPGSPTNPSPGDATHVASPIRMWDAAASQAGNLPSPLGVRTG